MPHWYRRTCSFDLPVLLHTADRFGHDDDCRRRNASGNDQFAGQQILFDRQPFVDGFDVLKRAARSGRCIPEPAEFQRPGESSLPMNAPLRPSQASLHLGEAIKHECPI
jgi:hypothetical protein